MLTRPKIAAGPYQDSFYCARMPRLKNFTSFSSCFSFPPTVNVLTYLEEELSALCKATFTEELLLKSWVCRLGAVWSLAGAKAGAEGSWGGSGWRWGESMIWSSWGKFSIPPRHCGIWSEAGMWSLHGAVNGLSRKSTGNGQVTSPPGHF